jgi:hypothetical protein
MQIKIVKIQRFALAKSRFNLAFLTKKEKNKIWLSIKN